MAKAIKVCRVCGQQYEACRTAKRIDGAFRWQDVACSKECGSIYLSRIIASRGDTSPCPQIGGIPTYSAKFPWSEGEEAYEEEIAEYFDDIK